MHNEVYQEYYFHDTYFFCQSVRNILCNTSDYLVGLNDFYGDGRIDNFSKPFPKYSYLHSFIEFIVRNILDEDMGMDKLTSLLNDMKQLEPLRRNYLEGLDNDKYYSFIAIYSKFENYIINRQKSFEDCDINDLVHFMDDYINSDEFDCYVHGIVEEIFYVLFSNKLVVHKFNEMMASAREIEVDGSESVKYTKANGCLKRKDIPAWVKSAVFHRDKGRCILCKKDVSGILNSNNKENFDHIVPLSLFGLNDISNIQLLCVECNQLVKKGNSSDTSYNYSPWYVV
ncbi:HNH endonuclease [Kluyvera ascorbata]|uniref:HNH endonuclease n=1 Tax=Kluyvera ascorbata TaxID=51288 RepID=UPI002AB9C9EB|nr:HNH endonuclease [Kluyvera ascorbata]MDZ4034401.1 HNH endonuclease [Kluyvera ascorbata]